MEVPSGHDIPRPKLSNELADKIGSGLRTANPDQEQKGLRVFYDGPMECLYIDGYTAPSGGRVGEIRVHQRNDDDQHHFFLWENMGVRDQKDAEALAQALQDMELEVTEIMTHPAITPPEEEAAEIERINAELKTRWEEKHYPTT